MNLDPHLSCPELRLSELFRLAGIEPAARQGDPIVRGLASDSRTVRPGEMFVCMPSAHADSHAYAAEAFERGAAAALAHSQSGYDALIRLGHPAAWVDGTFSDALWRLCKVGFGDPTRDLKLIGVTGTNGKTTVAWLIRDMLKALGEPAAYLGTLGIQHPQDARELSNTTPFAVELNRLIVEARAAGAQALAMEVSSHALEERRVDGLEFDAAVFTNLTQDHLDYHPSMTHYEAAKKRLFASLPTASNKPFRGAINVDDPVGARWAAELPEGVLRFGFQAGLGEEDLHAEALEIGLGSIRLRLSYRGETLETSYPLGGGYNAQNGLSAVAGMLALGYRLAEVAAALPSVRPVPGRFESIPSETGVGVLVDYAHTPDALQKVIEAARALRPGRIWTVFGCGGDRDRTKRPKMAAVVSETSDVSVLTSDNPRTEDPLTILADVRAGLRSGAESLEFPDRKEAIFAAVERAAPGDLVVIAGKGHENYQIIGRTKYPMDDREMAREALAAREAAKSLS